MVENFIRGGIFYDVYKYTEMPYWDVNNLHKHGMSQNLSVHGFKWEKEKSKFNQKFFQDYHDGSHK